MPIITNTAASPALNASRSGTAHDKRSAPIDQMSIAIASQHGMMLPVTPSKISPPHVTAVGVS